MRIERLRISNQDGHQRASGRLVWEDTVRPPRELWWETTEEHAADLEASPNALLLAALPLAIRHRESRIQVEGEVCAHLRDGLEATMAMFYAWDRRQRPVCIEALDGFRASTSPQERRTACFMSGGIDALALLRGNRIAHPPTDPAAIQEGIFVFGLNTYDFAGEVPRPERLDAFHRHLDRLRGLLDTEDVKAVPVYTNVRTFWSDFAEYGSIGWAMGLASAALTMSSRFTDVWIGSDGIRESDDPEYLQLLLARNFSTRSVEIRLGQAVATRWEKTRLVADWEPALRVLRSCLYQRIPAGEAINCGECEKCARTMLALLAMGKLRQATSFPHDDLTSEMLSVLYARTAGRAAAYAQCLEPLRKLGRGDLVRPIERALDRYARRRAWWWNSFARLRKAARPFGERRPG